MTLTRAALLLTILLWTGSLAAEPNEPSVEVKVSPEQIYEGQSVLYQVTVHNVEKPAPPELKGFDDFQIEPRGEMSLSSSQISFSLNGRPVEIKQSGRQYNYQLTPRKAGLLRIPAPTVTIAGRVLRGRELTLNVRAASDQDVAILEVTLDRPVVRPMQPFTLTLSVLVKGVPDEKDLNPVAVQQGALPALRIPWAIDERIPKGIVPRTTWQEWLRPLIDESGEGFSINDVTDRRDSFFFQSTRVGFQPKPKKVNRPDKSGKPTDYWRYDFVRTFSATKLGREVLGQAVLNGDFATKRGANGRLSGETVYAVSKRVEVIVEDAPPEGRPEGYIRAFGRFQANAELAPAKARTGDPMTLTLNITGRGTFQDATAPDLARLDQIAKRFKVYEATQEIKGDSCRFTYGLRPLEPGNQPFPSLTIAYYDPTAQRYETIRTEPIPLEVTRAEQLSSSQIVAGTGAISASRQELEARREGIFANITDPGTLKHEAVRPGRWLLGLGAALGVYLAAAAVAVQVRRRASDPAAVRRRGSARKARDRLAAGASHLAAGHTSEGASQIQDALVGLVADLADLPEAGLTAKDACRELAALGVEDELVAETRRLLETCDAARYAASRQNLNSLGAQAQDVLARLLLSLKAQKRFR